MKPDAPEIHNMEEPKGFYKLISEVFALRSLPYRLWNIPGVKGFARIILRYHVHDH